MYFFLLLLFVFISPPPPPFIPTAQNLYIHPTSAPTDPTSAAPVASSPLYAWGAVGRGLQPHCWGADIPPPHPPFTLGRAGRSCMLPEETFPSASSTLLLLVSIGFSFRGGVCFNYSPSAIADKNTSSLLCVPPGRWAAVGCVGCGFIHYLLCWLLFLGGWERCMGFPPPPLQTSRCSQVVPGASFTCCSSSPRMLGGVLPKKDPPLSSHV